MRLVRHAAEVVAATRARAFPPVRARSSGRRPCSEGRPPLALYLEPSARTSLHGRRAALAFVGRERTERTVRRQSRAVQDVVRVAAPDPATVRWSRSIVWIRRLSCRPDQCRELVGERARARARPAVRGRPEAVPTMRPCARCRTPSPAWAASRPKRTTDPFRTRGLRLPLDVDAPAL